MTLEEAKKAQSEAPPPAYIFYDKSKESYFIANFDCRDENISLAVFDKNGVLNLI